MSFAEGFCEEMEKQAKSAMFTKALPYLAGGSLVGAVPASILLSRAIDRKWPALTKEQIKAMQEQEERDMAGIPTLRGRL